MAVAMVMSTVIRPVPAIGVIVNRAAQ